MQDLAAQRLEALGPATVSYTNESGSEARRAQAEREFLRMERDGPPAGTKSVPAHDVCSVTTATEQVPLLHTGVGGCICRRQVNDFLQPLCLLCTPQPLSWWRCCTWVWEVPSEYLQP